MFIRAFLIGVAGLNFTLSLYGQNNLGFCQSSSGNQVIPFEKNNPNENSDISLVIQPGAKNPSGQQNYTLLSKPTDFSLIKTMTLSANSDTAIRNKQLGGPGNAFLSLIFPGLGGFFVEENKLRPAAVSILCVGFIGYGIAEKIQSTRYYSDYKNTPDPERRRRLYKKANGAHHGYLITTRIGAAFWMADVLYVAFIGWENTKNSSSATVQHTGGWNVKYAQNAVQLNYSVTF